MPMAWNIRRAARLGGLGALALTLVLGSARAQDKPPASEGRDRFGVPENPPGEKVESNIRDVAELFGRGALRVARGVLEKLASTYGAPVLVETIDSLEGRDVNDVARERSRQAGDRAIYILISKAEHRISRVLVPEPLASRLTVPRREQIREAFIQGFKEGDFDRGLRQGIESIEKALAETKGEGRLGETAPARTEPVASRSAEGSGDTFILRDQVRLTLAGARAIVAASESKAAAMKLKVNIAVVDDGGHLLTFARMDGARPASGYTALTKATTAATFRQATGPLPPGTTAPDPLLNLSLQNAAAASGGKVTTLYGGVPVVVDGQVIGGVGVGGGTGEQDAEVARAGIASLLEELKLAREK